MPLPRAWTLPEGLPVINVDNEAKLEGCSELLHAALCCGIDAEWPPQETDAESAGGGPPHATLVQLALWLPPEAGASAARLANGSNSCGGGDSGGDANDSASSSGGGAGSAGGGLCSACVLLLDLMALSQAAAKQELQALFRNKRCLKLGFGLVHDLRAIAAALGADGGSCIAVVTPACDVGTVHRFLRHRRVPGVHKAVDLGLSGMVEAQLGCPLDKALQCSAWGKRPLSSAQRAYAAADAACLLALLGSLIAAVGQPEEWPMADAPAAASGDAEPGEGNGEGAGGADGAAAGVAGALAEAADPADGSRGGDGSHAADPAGGGQRQQQLPLAGCLRQQLQAAAAAWGVRLEISGARAVRRGGRRGARQRRQQQQQQGLAGGARGEPCLGGLPRHVPWLDAQRQLTGEPRFIADVMVEGLARQLRLCGFDAESLQAAGMEKAPRHVLYRVMTERGEAEQRVVLTRDRTYISANYSDQAFLVQRDTKREQLEEVLEAFGLHPVQEDLLTRCARCNGDFIPEPMPAALLPAGHDVPPGILEQHHEFWVCARCSGVYWQGNQYRRAKTAVTELIAKMALA